MAGAVARREDEIPGTVINELGSHRILYSVDEELVSGSVGMSSAAVDDYESHGDVGNSERPGNCHGRQTCLPTLRKAGNSAHSGKVGEKQIILDGSVGNFPRPRRVVKARRLNSRWTYAMAGIVGGAMLGVCALSLTMPFRPDYSLSEKRELKQMPGPKVLTVLDGSYFGELSDWFSDTFPFREQLLMCHASLESYYGWKEEAIYTHGGGVKEEIPEISSETAPTFALENLYENYPEGGGIDGLYASDGAASAFSVDDESLRGAVAVPVVLEELPEEGASEVEMPEGEASEAGIAGILEAGTSEEAIMEAEAASSGEGITEERAAGEGTAEAGVAGEGTAEAGVVGEGATEAGTLEAGVSEGRLTNAVEEFKATESSGEALTSDGAVAGEALSSESEEAAGTLGAGADEAGGQAESTVFETTAEGDLILPAFDTGNLEMTGEQAGDVYVTEGCGYEIFYFSQQNMRDYASMVNTLRAVLPQDVSLYSIVAPNSFGVMLPEEVQDRLGSVGMDVAIQYMYSLMNPAVHRVSVFDALRSRTGEYIFFHTDHHWTQRGAYYAYREFCQEKGVAPHELSAFERQLYSGFYGTFYFSTNRNDSLRANPDSIEAFLPMGSNRLHVFSTEGTEGYVNVISDASGMNAGQKYSCFLMGDNPLSEIVNPNIEEDSAVLLLKDSYGNCFAPFLVDHYRHTYVMDYRYYHGNVKGFIQEHNVKDVIILNNIVAVGGNTAREILKGFSY